MRLYLLLLFNLLFITFSTVTINQFPFIIVEWSSVGPFPNQTLPLVPDTAANVTNRLIYMSSPPYNGVICMATLHQSVELLASRGCLGVITYFYDSRAPGFLVYGAKVDSSIPVGFVSLSVTELLVEEEGEFRFSHWDNNPWDIIMKPPGYTGQWAVLVLLMFFNSCFAGYRIILWLRSGVELSSLGFICLSLEFIANVLRVIQLTLIPYYNTFFLRYADIMYTTPICFTVISSILIVFFWLDLTTDPFYHGKFLGMMKKPAMVAICLIILLEIISVMIRSLIVVNIINAILGLYIGGHTIVVVFNLVAAKRILNSIKEVGKKKLIKITKRIIYSSISTLLGVM